MKPLLTALCGLALGACASTDNTEPPTPLQSFDASARVINVWTTRLSSQVNLSAFTLVPFITHDTVFAIDNQGVLNALSRERGTLKWQRLIDDNISVGIVGDSDHLYFGTLQGDLIAIAQADGSERWRAKMTTEIIALPSVNNDQIVARSIDGRVSLFDLQDGSERWTYSRNVPALTVRGNSPVLLTDNRAFIGLDSGKLITLDAANGKLLWEVTLSESAGRSEIERLSDVDANLLLDRGRLYAAGYQGKLAQIRASDGRINWARSVSALAGLRIEGDTLYVSDADSNIWALDKDTGAPIWKQDKLRARQLTAPVPVGNYLMVGDLNGYTHWLSRFDGRLVARKRIDGNRIINAAAISDDTLFVQTQYGLLAALQIVPD